MPAANAYLKKEELNNPYFKEFFYDMEVGFCESCKMVQLVNIVPYDKYIIPDETGKRNYAFFSSTSKSMESHFLDVAKGIEFRFLNYNDKVLEIGSNDGIFLKNFKNNRVLGVEPSENVAELAINQNIETITEFFSQELAKKILLRKGKFKVIFSANVTLNIIDIHDFIKGVNLLLENDGVFITEDPYLIDILETNAYDQIYDEHIWYFSLTSLTNLFSMHNLEIFDALKEDVHGGSMKVYVCKKGVYEKTERLKKYLEEEKQKCIHLINPYLEFTKKVEENKNKFINLIKNLKNGGNKIVGYAAASKGTIVQNYCNLDSNLINYVSDSTPYKQGLYTPGKHIPIVSPDKFHNEVYNNIDNNVDYAIIFAWNHAKEIIEKEQEFLKRGGKFIVHLPEPRIIGIENLQINNKLKLNDEKIQEMHTDLVQTKQHSDTTQSSELIEGVEIKQLKIFANDQGYLFETLRNDDKIYGNEFGQVLVSEIYPGVIKGFHLHEKHDEYTVCVKGNIKYIAVKEYADGRKKINTFVIGEKNPVLIKVPRGVWHGYMTLENKSATLVYLMSRPYNPKDPDTKEKDVFAFGDLWTVRHG